MHPQQEVYSSAGGAWLGRLRCGWGTGRACAGHGVLQGSRGKERTMSELHWTGAAVLLALAVLGSGSERPRRLEILSMEDFAREHSLDTVPRRWTWSRLSPRRCGLAA